MHMSIIIVSNFIRLWALTGRKRLSIMNTTLKILLPPLARRQAMVFQTNGRSKAKMSFTVLLATYVLASQTFVCSTFSDTDVCLVG